MIPRPIAMKIIIIDAIISLLFGIAIGLLATTKIGPMVIAVGAILVGYDYLRRDRL
jgi:hypothetical protein